MGQKWYQSKAYDLGLSRLGFILHFKGQLNKRFWRLLTFHVA
jgi:hypothetical protein